MPDWLDPSTFPEEGAVQLWIDPDNGVFCWLDPADYAWALQWKWSTTPSKSTHKLYVTRNTRLHGAKGKQTKVYLHKEIMLRKEPVAPSEAHDIADHLDGDSLNNRRRNLRWATPSMNRQNIGGIAAQQPELFAA